MSKIVITGNSYAAVYAIEQIRREDPACELTLLCPEGVLPFNRGLLAALVSKDSRESHMYIHPQQFFKDNNVQVIAEPLARVSTKRKHVTTENKTQVHYDKLLLTDLGAIKLPAVKGNHKSGVFDVFQLRSVKDLVKYLPFADNIIVPVTNFAGFEMACALNRAGKEVVIVSSGNGVLPEKLDEESAVLLKQIVEAKGIKVMADNAVEEILGDTELKAVRLKSGKVMAAEAVVFDAVQPDLRSLLESGLLEDHALKTGEFFNTLLPEVFACGAMRGDYDLTPEESMAQASCAASNMLNLGNAAYRSPLALRTFGHKICDGFYGGSVRLPEGGREHMKFDGPQNVYKKIFVVEDALIGAVWFNAPEEKEKVQQALMHKMSLVGIEDKFLQ